MIVEIRDEARSDLRAGYQFYEEQAATTRGRKSISACTAALHASTCG
jgi:hypothetical protein